MFQTFGATFHSFAEIAKYQIYGMYINMLAPRYIADTLRVRAP